MRLLRQRLYYKEIRGRFAYDTQVMRSLLRRRTSIIVSRMPDESKEDTSSESGQVNVIEAIPNINRGPYVKGSIRSYTYRKHAPLRRLVSDRELVYRNHKKEEAINTGPANRRGKQSKDYY
jgi:hypothetical protein